VFSDAVCHAPDAGRLKQLVSNLNLKVLGDEEEVAKEKSVILRYFTPNKGNNLIFIRFAGLSRLVQQFPLNQFSVVD